MQGDIYNIKGRIKAIDRELDIFYIGEGNYEITHKGLHFMRVTHDELDDRVLKRVREVVWMNKHTDIIGEIEKTNSKIESDKQKKVEDMAYNLAKDIQKPIRNSIYH